MTVACGYNGSPSCYRDNLGSYTVTSSALSRQVKDLEGALGYLLFERRTREVTLTVAGAAFVAGPQARRAALLYFGIRIMMFFDEIAGETIVEWNCLYGVM
jgi:hypothetical protein